jgi:hypothetical protein
MVHRDVFDESKPPELRQGDLDRPFDETVHPQSEIFEASLRERVPIGALRQLPVGPEER